MTEAELKKDYIQIDCGKCGEKAVVYVPRNATKPIKFQCNCTIELDGTEII